MKSYAAELFMYGIPVEVVMDFIASPTARDARSLDLFRSTNDIEEDAIYSGIV